MNLDDEELKATRELFVKNETNCEYCKNVNFGDGEEIFGKYFKLQKTTGFEKQNINKECWIMKNKNDDSAGIMVAEKYNGCNGNALYFNINYCPICGRKLN